MLLYALFFFFKQKTAYEMRISDWSSDVCSSDLPPASAETGKEWDLRSSVGLVPGKGGNQGRHHVFDVGFELLARRTRLLQLQLQLQETDVGRVRQARAVLGIAAAKAGLAEGGGQVFEPTLGDALHSTEAS